MLAKFVLIIVMSSPSGGNPTSVVANFDTFEACEYARKHVITGTNVIRSQGCYATGQKDLQTKK